MELKKLLNSIDDIDFTERSYTNWEDVINKAGFKISDIRNNGAIILPAPEDPTSRMKFIRRFVTWVSLKYKLKVRRRIKKIEDNKKVFVIRFVK